jgi:hypothetical protein
MRVIPETHPVHEIKYLRFYYYHWINISAGRILVPGEIIELVLSDSALIIPLIKQLEKKKQ